MVGKMIDKIKEGRLGRLQFPSGHTWPRSVILTLCRTLPFDSS